MGVVVHVRLIEGRLAALRTEQARRRDVKPPRQVPDWAADVLVRAGLTRSEVESFNGDPPPPTPGRPWKTEHLDEAIALLEAALSRQAEPSASWLDEIVPKLVDRPCDGSDRATEGARQDPYGQHARARGAKRGARRLG